MSHTVALQSLTENKRRSILLLKSFIWLSEFSSLPAKNHGLGTMFIVEPGHYEIGQQTSLWILYQSTRVHKRRKNIEPPYVSVGTLSTKYYHVL